MNPDSQKPLHLKLVKSIGPWPFITKRVYQRPGRSLSIWQSRYHRKSLSSAKPDAMLPVHRRLIQSLWQPRRLNWWIGIIFAIGSLLFIIGGTLSLSPSLEKPWPLNAWQINFIFFVGSIPFTTAAYLQLFQAANSQTSSSSEKPPGQERIYLFGWKPHDIGWLSCALQFPGTILFNLQTFDALAPHSSWLWQDLVIWAPNLLGSILFLASGYLAFIETCHCYWAWCLDELSWWVAFTNFIGCVGFMVAAIFAVILPQAPSDFATIATVFTVVGAFGFFTGSSLMLPEAAWPLSERIK